MITKTLNLDEAYQTLFKDVRTASDGAISVDNLEAYYGSIEEIAALDPKFLRLPLDEPLFEIDANTRKIAVPAEFKANGVSVQRDHLAEVIFFRIARFFDYTDLATCDIVINWKMGANEGKTTRFIKFEEPFLVDEVQTNGIIFGWPINDIVTNKSGALTFAVEFFKKAQNSQTQEEEVIYRFNTLPASVNIKDGLIISDDAEVYKLDDAILRTLVNSKFGEGTAAVGNVVWLTGNGQGLVAGEGTVPDVTFADFAESINLNTVIIDGEPSSDPVSLYTEGYVDEGTKIRYTNANGDELTATPIKVVRPRVQAEYDANSGLLYYASAIAEEPLSAEAAAAAAEAEEELWITGPLEEGLRYFKMDGSALKEADDTDLASWGKANAVELFVIAAMITADKAGSYYIKAQGYKEGQMRDDNGELMYDENDEPIYEKIGNGEVRATSIVTIPLAQSPSAINIVTSELDRSTLDSGYSFNDDQMENVMFLDAEDQGTLTASAVVDDFGALQFTWKKKIGDDSEFSNVESGDIDFQSENNSVLEVRTPGEYKVSVVNFLNGDRANEVESEVIIASQIAGKITEATVQGCIGLGEFGPIPAKGLTFNSARMQTNSATIKIVEDSIAITGQRGNFEFEWYKEILDDDLQHLDWEKLEGKTSSQLKIESGDATYLPVVKNNCNGSVYTFVIGDGINVNDQAT